MLGQLPTHSLVYKASSIDWKRKRLAAQLKASSEGLDAAIAAFDNIALAIGPSPWHRAEELTDLAAYILQLFDHRRVPDTLKPASISRFCENFQALARAIKPSRGVRELIASIDDELTRMQPTTVPMSLSLYQLFLGILCEKGPVQRIENLTCHVTPELQTIFPMTRHITGTFDYDT